MNFSWGTLNKVNESIQEISFALSCVRSAAWVLWWVQSPDDENPKPRRCWLFYNPENHLSFCYHQQTNKQTDECRLSTKISKVRRLHVARLFLEDCGAAAGEGVHVCRNGAEGHFAEPRSFRKGIVVPGGLWWRLGAERSWKWRMEEKKNWTQSHIVAKGPCGLNWVFQRKRPPQCWWKSWQWAEASGCEPRRRTA